MKRKLSDIGVYLIRYAREDGCYPAKTEINRRFFCAWSVLAASVSLAKTPFPEPGFFIDRVQLPDCTIVPRPLSHCNSVGAESEARLSFSGLPDINRKETVSDSRPRASYKAFLKTLQIRFCSIIIN